MAVYPKVLLVEGNQEIRVIPELIEKNGVVWKINDKQTVVHIKGNKGDRELVDADKITAALQSSELSILGIVIDADKNPASRWESIRNASRQSIPDIPDTLPEDGLIHTTSEGIKFGIWIMPDNRMRGMLETFLTSIIPTENKPLWEFAQSATQEAKSKGATFKDTQLDKANIYTWLAWQDPPGLQLHEPIKHGKDQILNPQHPNAQKFVAWFKALYDLT